MTHTVEPWSIGVEHDGFTPINGNGWDKFVLVVTRMEDDKPTVEGVANVARIVACVNALAGIPTDAVERVRFAAVPHIIEQRDDLLAAARAAEAVFARQKWRDDSPDPEAVALRMLRAAIARAEGSV